MIYNKIDKARLTEKNLFIAKCTVSFQFSSPSPRAALKARMMTEVIAVVDRRDCGLYCQCICPLSWLVSKPLSWLKGAEWTLRKGILY